MRFFKNEIFFHNGLYLIHSQGVCRTCYFNRNWACNLPRNGYSNNVYFGCPRYVISKYGKNNI